MKRFLNQYRCSRCGKFVVPIFGGTTDRPNNVGFNCHWRCFGKDSVVDKFKHARIECTCGRMHDVKIRAKVTTFNCRCGIEYMIAEPLMRVGRSE